MLGVRKAASGCPVPVSNRGKSLAKLRWQDCLGVRSG